MKEIPADQYQSLLLDILKSFQKYCNKHNVKIMLCGGSALGAIRHKGFIPWDDDIDLYVFHDGFDKLISLTKKNPYIDDQNRYKILMPGKLPNVLLRLNGKFKKLYDDQMREEKGKH